MQEVNQHSTLHIRGHIADASVAKFVDSMEHPLLLKYTNGNVDITWEGIITDLFVYRDRGNAIAEVTVTGKTIEADRQMISRTFCNSQQTMTGIVKGMNDQTLSRLTGPQIKKPFDSDWLVQYEETNWQMLIRLAQKQNEPVFVDDCQQLLEIYYGFDPQTTKHELSSSDRLALNSKRAVLTTRSFYPFGITLKVESKDLAIVGATYHLHDFDGFVAEYELISPKSWRSAESIHPLRQSTLRAKVIGRKDDENLGRIAIQLPWEDAHQVGERYLPWATPFSMNQVGFHALPLVGETVYVFFPSEEEDVYVALVERTTANDKLVENEQYWQAADGVEIKLAEQSITLSIPSPNESKSKRHILLEDKGVQINFDKSTFFMDEQKVELSMEDHTKITLDPKRISLSKGKTTFTLDDEGVQLNGTKIELESKQVQVSASQKIKLKSRKITMEK